MSLPTPEPQPKPTPPSISILPPKSLLFTAPHLGTIAASTYSPSPIEQFLAPYRHQHPHHHTRGYTQRIHQRILDPSVFTFVAYAVLPSGEPDREVGYVQFQRLGSDAGQRRVVQRWSWLGRAVFWVGRWIVDFGYKLSFLPWGNRSESRENVKTFISWGEEQHVNHWEKNRFPERQDRYHVRSLVVLKEYHRLGIGRRLMEEVIRRAREEGVCIGLESSVMGEGLYKKLGFVVLGRFRGQVPGEMARVEGGKKYGRGGILGWFPEGWVGSTEFVAKVDEDGNVDV